MGMHIAVDVLGKRKMSAVTLLLLFLTLGIFSFMISNCLQQSTIVGNPQTSVGVVSAEGSDGYSGRPRTVQGLRGLGLMTTHVQFHRFPSSGVTHNGDTVHSTSHQSFAESKAPHSEVSSFSEEFQLQERRTLLSTDPDLSRKDKSTLSAATEEVSHDHLDYEGPETHPPTPDYDHMDYARPGMNQPIIQDPPMLPPRSRYDEVDYDGPGIHPPIPDYQVQYYVYAEPGMNEPTIGDPPIVPRPRYEEVDYEGPGVHPPIPDYGP